MISRDCKVSDIRHSGWDPSIVLGRQAVQILRQDYPSLLHFHYPAAAKGSAAIGSLTGLG